MRVPAGPVIALTFALVAAIALAGGLKIKTQHDKTFNFAGLTTYAWHPTGAGDVKLLIADHGDANDIRRRLEPTLLKAVEDTLQRQGFTRTSGDAPLYVNYYVLIGSGTSAQEMGQFVPATTEWGLPILPGATQSLEAYRRGSLILDVSSSVKGTVVWRGSAEAQLDDVHSDAERLARITEAVQQMLKKFPPKK